MHVDHSKEFKEVIIHGESSNVYDMRKAYEYMQCVFLTVLRLSMQNVLNVKYVCVKCI